MKNLFALAIVAAALVLCGCDTDKSDDTQVMAPVNNQPYDRKGGTAPNVPDNVKGNIPGAK